MTVDRVDRNAECWRDWWAGAWTTPSGRKQAHVIELRGSDKHEVSVKCWCRPRPDPLIPGVWHHRSTIRGFFP